MANLSTAPQWMGLSTYAVESHVLQDPVTSMEQRLFNSTRAEHKVPTTTIPPSALQRTLWIPMTPSEVSNESLQHKVRPGQTLYRSANPVDGIVQSSGIDATSFLQIVGTGYVFMTATSGSFELQHLADVKFTLRTTDVTALVVGMANDGSLSAQFSSKTTDNMQEFIKEQRTLTNLTQNLSQNNNNTAAITTAVIPNINILQPATLPITDQFHWRMGRQQAELDQLHVNQSISMHNLHLEAWGDRLPSNNKTTGKESISAENVCKRSF
jgi:hypothetical protein